MAAVVCTQFGTRTSEDTKEKPRINFYGKLTTKDKTYTVENITIGNRYEQIPMYAEPQDTNQNPAIDTFFIDLDEIAEIYPTQKNARDGIKKFNKRDYIEITVINKAPEAKGTMYIIENSHKIRCDVITESGPLEKEVALEALKKLEIQGHKQKEIEGPAPRRAEKKSAAQEAVCSKALKELEILEKDARTEDEKKRAAQLKNDIQQLCR